ncbi:MerR family transcriptional regulator [Hoyosella altamirensis]|uniref:Uncharacterized protein n=1 Tax=Hoyosella altamirensis TaxID=616997 RepID=A0A839RV44_9ACTN|nr:hypothetical protein [Hoyosella altamirensis]MBB3040187.1 hypothetical protein [Hoyosella altamirensis]
MTADAALDVCVVVPASAVESALLAKFAGLTASARFYDDAGLLRPDQRSDRGLSIAFYIEPQLARASQFY